MYYTIKAALNSGCFEEVMVSTNSEKYALFQSQSLHCLLLFYLKIQIHFLYPLHPLTGMLAVIKLHIYPFGDGTTSNQIINTILGYLENREKTNEKHFYDISFPL